MPILDLRLAGSERAVNPLAGARLTALMLYPDDRRQRHRFVESARAGAGPPIKTILPLMQAGAAVGDLIVYMLQDHYSGGGNASLNAALPLVAAANFHEAGLPLHGLGPLEMIDAKAAIAKLETRRVGRRALLSNFHRFRQVAHFWVVVVACDGDGNLDDVDFLKSRETDAKGIERLARFVAAAHAILERSAPLVYDARGARERLLAKPWRVRLPRKIEIPPPDVNLRPAGPFADGVRRKALGK